MAVQAGLQIGATLLPYLLAFLGGGQKQDDIYKQLGRLMDLFRGELGPLAGEAYAVGAQRGRQLGQDVSGALGGLEASSSGVGAVTGGLASSLASQTGMASRLQFLSLVPQLAAQTVGQASQPQPGAGQNALAALGMGLAQGKNPFLDLVNLLYKSQPTTTKGGYEGASGQFTKYA